MERSSRHDDIAVALAELRPEPHPDFAAELDARVAAGFQPHSRPHRSSLAALAARLRGLSPQRLLLATGSAALAAIVIATVVVASVDSGPGPVALEQPAAIQHHAAKPPIQLSRKVPRASNPTDASSAALERGGPSGIRSSSQVPHSATNGELQSALPSEYSSAAQPLNRIGRSGESLAGFSPTGRHREIERSAEISLLSEPTDVAEDSAKVFAAVHDADGIVLHSTTSSGKGAGAHFDLLIPSAKLGDALAALSAIDEVQSRHEATDDITAPVVSAREELQDSRARIDALLGQLSAAETETEAAAVEAELRGERRHTTRLRARLANLARRTAYSRVSVRIEGGAAADSGGAWGFDDAIGDAGHILGIAAGVTVVGLAVITPLALLALLAWLTHRLWLRTRRERALDA
jgi:hypothetical protein